MARWVECVRTEKIPIAPARSALTRGTNGGRQQLSQMRYPSPFLVLALVGVHTGRAQDAELVTLSAVQGSDCETGTCADSPLEGQTVRVEAIVVGLASGGFFIQVRWRRCHPYDSAIRRSMSRSAD